MDNMRRYEAAFIIKPDVEEDGRNTILERVKGVIESAGAINEVDEWGTRRLAYEINDYTSGYYIIIDFEASTDIINELERNFKIIGDVLRYMVVRKED